MPQRRGANLLDGGAPFYDTYAAADGKHLAVGCLEPKFFAEFAQRIGLDERFIKRQYDPRSWPEMRAAIAARLATRTRDDWCRELDGSDACVAPILSLHEAPSHPHAQARGAFVEIDGVMQAAPAPRFSRTAAATPRARARGRQRRRGRAAGGGLLARPGRWRCWRAARLRLPESQGPHDDRASPRPTPRHSASLIVLRDGVDGLEVLMLRRAEREGDQNSGAAVFPGGHLDRADVRAHPLCIGLTDAQASAHAACRSGRPRITGSPRCANASRNRACCWRWIRRAAGPTCRRSAMRTP